MNITRKIEFSAFITVVLSIIGFAFWLGDLNSKVATLVTQQAQISNEITALKSSVPDFKEAIDKKVIESIESIDKRAEEQRQSLLDIKVPIAPTVVVLEPTWVHEDQVFKALSEQILIKVNHVWVNFKNASFDIDIPGNEMPDLLKNIYVGDRRTFTYKDEEFIFEFLDVRVNNEDSSQIDEAQITIVKRL